MTSQQFISWLHKNTCKMAVLLICLLLQHIVLSSLSPTTTLLSDSNGLHIVLRVLVGDSGAHFRPLRLPIVPLSSPLELNGILLTVYIFATAEAVINKHVTSLSLVAFRSSVADHFKSFTPKLVFVLLTFCLCSLIRKKRGTLFDRSHRKRSNRQIRFLMEIH